MMKQYDINAYDRGAYLTGALPVAERYHEWVLCPYEIDALGAGYGTGAEKTDLNLVLTAEEVETLTLGWGQDLGGDYIEDDDFWIDSEFFLNTYKDVPERVKAWLANLPTY